MEKQTLVLRGNQIKDEKIEVDLGQISKNEPSKIVQKLAFTNFTWSILEYFVPFDRLMG